MNIMDRINEFRVFFNKNMEVIINLKAKNTQISFANLFIFLIRKACTGASYEIVTFDDIVNGTHDFCLTTYIKAREKISLEILKGINKQSVNYFYKLKEAIINDANENKNIDMIKKIEVKENNNLNNYRQAIMKEDDKNKERQFKNNNSLIKIVKENEKNSMKCVHMQSELKKKQSTREEIREQLLTLLNKMDNTSPTNENLLIERGEVVKTMEKILNDVEKSDISEWINENETIKKLDKEQNKRNNVNEQNKNIETDVVQINNIKELKQSKNNNKNPTDPNKVNVIKKDIIENKNNNLEIQDATKINKEQRKGRLIAADGTYLCFDKKNQQFYFVDSPAEKYSYGLISCLYDIENMLPISYLFSEIKNEVFALKSQIDYLRPGDTLVLDRNYYSRELVVFFHSRGIDVICRLKENLKAVQIIKEENMTVYQTNIKNFKQNIPFTIFHYTIKSEGVDKEFYVGTTIQCKENIYLEKIYGSRWDIEVHFKFLKYKLNFGRIKAKNLDFIFQDIELHLFVMIYVSFFNMLIELLFLKRYTINMLDDYITQSNLGNYCDKDLSSSIKFHDKENEHEKDGPTNDFKINKSILIHATYVYLLPLLIENLGATEENYVGFINNKIFNIMASIGKFIVEVKTGRKFPLERKKPLLGWSDNKNNLYKRKRKSFFVELDFLFKFPIKTGLNNFIPFFDNQKNDEPATSVNKTSIIYIFRKKIAGKIDPTQGSFIAKEFIYKPDDTLNQIFSITDENIISIDILLNKNDLNSFLAKNSINPDSIYNIFNIFKNFFLGASKKGISEQFFELLCKKITTVFKNKESLNNSSPVIVSDYRNNINTSNLGSFINSFNELKRNTSNKGIIIIATQIGTLNQS